MKLRIIAAFSAITALILVIVVVPLGITLTRYQTTQLKQDLLSDANVLGNLVEDNLEANSLSGLQTVAINYQSKTGARVIIVDKNGSLVADSGISAPDTRSFLSRPEMTRALHGEQSTGIRRSQTLGTGLVFASVPIGSGGKTLGALRLTYTTNKVDSRVRKQWFVLAGLSMIAIIVTAITAGIFERWIVRPISNLSTTATEFGKGNLDRRVPVEGPIEIQTLATAFNQTATRLESVMNAQESFVADISHQLRTPLTALRLRIDNLLDENTAHETVPQSELESLASEISRLSGIVESLLALARIDEHHSHDDVNTFEVNDLLTDLVDTYQPLAEERRVALVIEGFAQITANRSRVEQVVENLLANALDVAPEDTPVKLIVESGQDAVSIFVIDQGPGFSDDTPMTSQRFGGMGIGLTIARRLAAADGGYLELRNDTEQGTVAEIRYITG